ncbi:hypothetical protein F0344_34895 (plasmid) [Streptomyces finlayi]|uniref:Aromatic amino acid lyase n=1 Tax=Streptomyces finlayi TaxID=67296 RepID=A0A7G7BWI3_9ACTN|nr:hypothetical protein F0344_34895 [Streptomyces finlayi]
MRAGTPRPERRGQGARRQGGAGGSRPPGRADRRGDTVRRRRGGADRHRRGERGPGRSDPQPQHRHRTAVPRGRARVIVVAQLCSLAKGYSAVRPVVLERLAGHLNHRLAPAVPEVGSLGAGGDTTPLAHVASTLIGEGHSGGTGWCTTSSGPWFRCWEWTARWSRTSN